MHGFLTKGQLYTYIGSVIYGAFGGADSLRILVSDRKLAVTPHDLPGRAANPLHGQAFEKFNLLVYWFQEYDFTDPTLQMAKTCLKRSFSED